jgi:flagellar biosynthesis/type III secretory pathway protein FliH
MGVVSDGLRQHRYQTCRDESCQRFACAVYREGFRNGYAQGYAEGEAIGHAQGYAEGYAAGHDDGAASGTEGK